MCWTGSSLVRTLLPDLRHCRPHLVFLMTSHLTDVRAAVFSSSALFLVFIAPLSKGLVRSSRARETVFLQSDICNEYSDIERIPNITSENLSEADLHEHVIVCGGFN